MAFKLEFETENNVFLDQPDAEVSRILRNVADCVFDCGDREGVIMDMHGNSIGRWTFKIDADLEY